MKHMKRLVSARVGKAMFKRIERLSEADKRSFSNIVELCLDHALPDLEREILGEQFVGGATGRAEPVAANGGEE